MLLGLFLSCNITKLNILIIPLRYSHCPKSPLKVFSKTELVILSIRIDPLIFAPFIVIALFAPALLRNRAVDYFRDFLPDSVNKRLDNTTPKKQVASPAKPIVIPQRGGKVKTSQVRKVSEQLKKLVASNQKWNCKSCNNMLDATYEVDHIISLEDGGDNNISNLRALCRNCHGKKTMTDNIRRRYPNGKL